MSKIRSPDVERALSVVLALTSAVVAATCAAGGITPAKRATAPSAVDSGLPAPLPPQRVSAPVASTATAPIAPPTSGLTHFHAALREMAAGHRTRSVHVLWFGDSHTYADFWPDAVRVALQKRFGNGGPGYVLVGMKPYRHAGVEVGSSGQWRHEPSAPSTSVATGDGQFGLFGIRTIPDSSDASATCTPSEGAVKGRAHWQLMFRAASPSDRLQVRVGDGAFASLDGKAGKPGPEGSPIRRWTLDGDATARLDVRAAGGAPELFGAVLESTTPGVVVDTLGINGARAATPLAWNEAAWVAELGAREPDLVVLAYGTNEIAENRPVERYPDNYRKLLARIRRAAPEVDCVMAGPTDWDAADGTSNPRVVEIDRVERATAAELGCRYFSVYDAMGGDGSHLRWEKESPALGANDHIHLTPAGYAKLGALIATELLADYGP